MRFYLLKQRLSDKRNWSLPGGKLERGETINEGIIREMKKETGLDVEIECLLYLCDVFTSGNSLLHITFLLKQVGGTLKLPTNEHDENPIKDVQFIPVTDLEAYGFSNKFVTLIKNNFPNRGNYVGDKTNIGLGI